MKQGLLFILSIYFYCNSFCQQQNYWQQQVDYNIDVSLIDSSASLDGFISMQYHNNSPDTLRFIWIHLWPNAYKNDRTAFSDQLLENGRKDFYFSNDNKKGYINRLDFTIDKATATFEEHPTHQDIIKLVLNEPLLPGNSVKIETPFHVQLPAYFSRSGHVDHAYQVTQWYPKPAVYDKKGWHEMPYLDQGEFYSEFGTYEVQISLPENFIVAATGKVKNQTSSNGIKTLQYVQDNIHDFAWFADKEFIVMKDTIQLKNRTIDLYSYYHSANASKWKNSMELMKSAILTKSKWVGEYPYDIVSVVEKKGKGSGGGMEYPTITLIDEQANEKSLDEVIYHEVGHNWFYGILASNERQHPWMDEGMNSYYDKRYMQETYVGGIKENIGNKSFVESRTPDDLLSLLQRTLITTKKDQPIETPAADFSMMNYGAIAYNKTAEWMQLLEKEIGKQLFDSVMHTYFEKWKFKHPYPEDFKRVVQETSGQQLDSLFSLLNKKGPLTKPEKKTLRVKSFFSLKETDNHNYIFVVPAIGYNNYDKFMAGVLLHNYTLPPTRLRFVAAPLYATGSKQFNGIGNINFSTFFDKKLEKVVVGITAAKFSTKQSLDTNSNKLYENFHKVVPSVQVYFKHKPRSQVTSWIDIRSYLIGQQNFDPSKFEFIAGSDSTVRYPTGTINNNSYINEMSFNLQNYRVLYPYDYQVKLQQGKGFYRVDLTVNYFFNYAKGGGFQARLFAAKFGYLGNDRSGAYQYQPKLLAATGDEDYTYSNYFIGRSASTSNSELPVKNLGLAGQQIMIRDGGLKLRVDQYGSVQGRTENWLAAVNFNTTIPDLFPVKLPLKLFLDVGTNAESWKRNAATTKFLYVGGLQLSLFRNILAIYAPLVYSKDFKEVLQTDPERNKFFKKLTFSINIQNISLRKLVPQLPL